MVDQPHDILIEQSVLRVMMLDAKQARQACEALRPEHFYRPEHAAIFEVIAKAIERGGLANPLTIAPFVAGAFPGGQDEASRYLAEMIGEALSGRAADYAKALVDLALRRDLQAIGRDIAEKAALMEIGTSPIDIIEATEAALMRLNMASSAKPLVCLRDAVDEAADAADHARRSGTILTGVTTGLRDLDWRLGGLQPSELVVLGARPSMGKTDLAFNIAVNAARAHKHGRHGGAVVLMFSQEMGPRQLGARYLAREIGVATDAQRRGEISDEDFARIAGGDYDLPLWIDGTARVTPAHVLRRARRLAQHQAVGLIIIDHLNIMGAPDGFRSQGETAVVTEITRELKGVATTLGVPVLLLSQLSRQVEAREDKRPTLSDLRQSGSIEQDADTVMFLYRDAYYLERSEPSRRPEEPDQKFSDRYDDWRARVASSHGLAEVIVAKQRMGTVGTTVLHYDGSRSLFSDLVR